MLGGPCVYGNLRTAHLRCMGVIIGVLYPTRKLSNTLRAGLGSSRIHLRVESNLYAMGVVLRCLITYKL